MRFDIMTLFPELVSTVLGTSIIGRAASAGHIDIRTHDIRDWSPDKWRRVDGAPAGGGAPSWEAPASGGSAPAAGGSIDDIL